MWLTGLPSSGKSTIAHALEEALLGMGHEASVLDGDNLRHGLCADLGFTPADRRENIRRAAEVARLLNEAGLIVIAAFITPYRADRGRARGIIGAERFVEVFVDAPLEVCAARDPKGLYARALRGALPDFTGVGAPYEPPEQPAVHLRTAEQAPEPAVAAVVAELRSRGIL